MRLLVSVWLFISVSDKICQVSQKEAALGEFVVHGLIISSDSWLAPYERTILPCKALFYRATKSDLKGIPTRDQETEVPSY